MGSSKKQIIGYQYFMGIHMVCATDADELQAILVGDRIAWEGSVTSNQTISIDEPDLFGGLKDQGGVVGDVDVMFGDDDQTVNPYLQKVLGGVVPAFRGVVSLVLNQVYVTSMVKTPKPWAPRWKRIGRKDWYESKAEIAGVGVIGDDDFIPNGSMNYAHIMHEIITNRDWGMGKAYSTIDDVDFMATADTLFDENMGGSFKLTSPTKMKDLAKEILKTIAGILYSDRGTGQYKLKLIRTPTQAELDAALVFDESNTAEVVSFERPSFSEMVNEVTVKYKRQSDGKDLAVSAHDLGSITTTGEVINQTMTMVGVDNATLANRIAEREVRNYSTPLAKIKIRVNRAGSAVNPGDIIKFSSTDYAVQNMIIRVFSVDYGVLSNGYVMLEGVEDIFTMPLTTYLSPGVSQWTDPIQPPVEIIDKVLLEAPYFELSRQLEDVDFSALDDSSAFIQYMAKENPGTSNYHYEIHTDAGGTFETIGDGDFSPTATVKIAFGRLSADANIQIENIDFVNSDIVVGSYAYIGEEAVRVTAINVNSETMSIARGVLDTVPVNHAVGEIIYFVQDNDGFADTEYSISETINAKALTKTGQGVLSGTGVAIDSITLEGRFVKPYPVCKVVFNNESFPATLNGGADTLVFWTYQNRLINGEQGPSTDWYSTTSFPEFGTQVEVKFYGETDNLILTGLVDVNTAANSEGYNLTATEEKALSGVSSLDSGRVLVSAALGVADHVVQTPMKEATNNEYQNSSFQRIGPDWGTVIFYPPSNIFESHFVSGSDGAKTTFIGTTANINDFVIRSENQWNLNANLAYADTVGQSGGLDAEWRIVVSNRPATNPNPATNIARSNQKRTVFLQSIVDHRELAGTHQLFIGYERSNHLRFLVPNDGINQQKNLILSNMRCYIMNYAKYFSNQFDPQFTEFDIEHEFIADETLLDSVNDYHWPLTYNANGINSTHASSITEVGTVYKSYLTGRLFYITYMGADVQKWNTSGKNLDITNILGAHIDVAKFKTAKTKIMTLNGSAMVEIAEFMDFVFAGRSNNADTEVVEWHSKSSTFQILSSVDRTNVSGPTSTGIFISSLTCDWSNQRFFVVRRDWDRIYKYQYDGTLDLFVDLPSPFQNEDGELYVGQNYLFIIKPGNNTWYIDKDLVGPWIQAPFSVSDKSGVSNDRNIDIRPNSALFSIHDNETGYDLYSEIGGTVDAGGPVKRLNSSLKVEVKSIKGALDSHQTLTHTITRSGYGFRYGAAYGN